MPFGRLERNPPSQPMGDINMTPLIDVMLVLLVIFMIGAPLMTSSLKLQLPKSPAATAGATGAVIAVSLGAGGELRLGSESLGDEVFDARLRSLASDQPGLEVHLRADQAAPYGLVAALIGRLQAAGLNRIAFVTERPATAGPATPAR